MKSELNEFIAWSVDMGLMSRPFKLGDDLVFFGDDNDVPVESVMDPDMADLYKITVNDPEGARE